MDTNETKQFIRQLRSANLTSQERKTIRGQALSGDLIGAKKGLKRIQRKDNENRVHKEL